MVALIALSSLISRIASLTLFNARAKELKEETFWRGKMIFNHINPRSFCYGTHERDFYAKEFNVNLLEHAVG